MNFLPLQMMLAHVEPTAGKSHECVGSDHIVGIARLMCS